MDSLTGIGAPGKKIHRRWRVVLELAKHAECAIPVYGETRVRHVVAANDARAERKLWKNEPGGNETRTRRTHADDGVTTRRERVAKRQAAVGPRERA
jgi:hypothetical protein